LISFVLFRLRLRLLLLFVCHVSFGLFAFVVFPFDPCCLRYVIAFARCSRVSFPGLRCLRLVYPHLFSLLRLRLVYVCVLLVLFVAITLRYLRTLLHLPAFPTFVDVVTVRYRCVYVRLLFTVTLRC